MGTKLTTAVFDYEQIEDRETRGKLNYYAGEIRK